MTPKRFLFFVFQLILLVLLLCALYVSLWREGLAVLPEVEHYLEKKASALFGADIALVDTQGYFIGLKPHIRLSAIDVRQSHTQVRLLQLQDVHVSLEFWNSVFRRSLVFETIRIGKVRVQPQVRGAIQRKALIKQLEWQPWISVLFKQKQVLIDEFELVHPSLDVRFYDMALMEFGAQGRSMQGRFTASFQGMQTAGRLQMQSYNDPLLPEGRVKAFIDVAPFIPTGTGSGLYSPILESLQRSQAWVTLEAGEVHSLRLQTSSRGLFKDALHFDVQAELDESWSGRGVLTQGMTQSLFSSQMQDQEVSIASEVIPVAQVAGVVQMIAPQWLAKVHHGGYFKFLALKNGALSAHFDNLVVGSELGKVGPLSGHFIGRQDFGRITIEPGFFDVHAPLFLRTTLKDIETAAVEFFWKTDGMQTALIARDWHLNHGDVNGRVDVRFDKKPLQRAHLELLADIRSASTARYQQYLPLVLKPTLLKWLDQALSAGRLESGQILFHGPLRRRDRARALSVTAPKTNPVTAPQTNRLTKRKEIGVEPLLQLALHGKEIGFQFHDAWPALTQGNVNVFMGDNSIEVDLHSGQSLDIELQGPAVIDLSQELRAPRLQSQFKAEGDLAAGFEYLRQSPLSKKLSQIFPVVLIQGGQFKSTIDLTLDLAGLDQPYVKVDTEVLAGDVRMKPLRLDLAQIHGMVHFNTETGLSATGLQGFTLGRHIESHIEKGSGANTLVRFKSMVAAERLTHWLGWPLLSVLEGEALINGEIDIPWQGGALKTVLSSNLKGLGIGLPDIFGKQLHEVRHWRFAAEIADQIKFDILDENRYRIQMPYQTEFSLYDIAIGDTAYSLEKAAFGAFNTIYKGRSLAIDLGLLSLDSWMDFKNRSYISGTNLPQQTVDPLQFLPDSFNFSIADFRYHGASFGSIRLSSYKEPGGWRIQWDGNSVGRAFLPRQSAMAPVKAPVRVTFDRLTLPVKLFSDDTQTGTNFETNDKKNTLSLSQNSDIWPAVEIKIGSLFLDQRYVGQFELSGEPAVGGYTLQSIYGQFAGLHFRGDGHISDTFGSEYQFDLRGGRLDQAFGLLHQLKWINSEKAQLTPSSFYGQVSLQWPDVIPQLTDMKGSGSLTFEKGMIKGVEGLSPIKWLSLLSAERFTRRLRFDFADLSQKGLAFDSLAFNWQQQGLKFNNGLFYLQSPSLELKTKGWVDFGEKQIFQECVAIIPIIDHLLLPVVAAGGLPAAATAYVLDKALGDKLDALTRVTWKVSGDLASPQASQSRTQ